jgi:hypothetical protein
MTYIYDVNIIINIQVWYRHNRLVNLANDDRVWRSPGQWRDLRIWLIENVNDMDYDAAGVDLQDYDRRVFYFARKQDAMMFTLKWS